MPIKTLLAATAATLCLAIPALAEIAVHDAYARVSGATAKAGAAFMVIVNTGDQDDRLVSAASDVAARTELHTHMDDGNGVMKMIHVEEGFAIPAGSEHALARGGDHVMFMGLNRSLAHGDSVTVTLTFEKAGDITLDIPVDLERAEGAMGSMGAMNHGAHKGQGECGQGHMGNHAGQGNMGNHGAHAGQENCPMAKN